MLTGKAKEDFEKWICSKSVKEFALNYLEMTQKKFSNQINLSILNAFNCSPFSMQYGVYVDFFDSVGIKISISDMNEKYIYCVTFPIISEYGITDTFISPNINTRTEARQKAIEKANEIYNEQKKMP